MTVPINQQSSTTTQAIVEVCGVNKAFGRNNVLKDVSLMIEEGRSMALVGRNGAGKSTLVGVLTGLLMPDGGVVNFGAAPAPGLHDRAAWRRNVACVYQHSTVVPTLSVAENLLLNQQPRAVGGRIDWRAMRRQAMDALSEWDINVDVTAEAHSLSVEQRQIVEIARALLQGARFIILDEPTAHLDKRAVDRLFARIRKLQHGGISFLFISHYLEEIYEICHDVTVMRDGRVILTRPLNTISKAEVVAAMVGDTGQLVQIKAGPAYRAENPGQPLLSVHGLTIGQMVSDVSFDLNAGECLGLAGLANSGKIEIGDVLAGLVLPDAGGAKLDGKALPFGSVASARRAGIGFVPNDRRHRGIIPQLSLAENLILTITDRLGPLGTILPALRNGIARTMITDMGIVASSPSQPIVELSGGNQQKAVMARALSSLPRILVLVCPTQGVDIASKAALFRIVESVRMAGTGVLIISDDLDDLYICQRTLVMFRGRISGEFTAGFVERDLVSAIEGVHENA